MKDWDSIHSFTRIINCYPYLFTRSPTLALIFYFLFFIFLFISFIKGQKNQYNDGNHSNNLINENLEIKKSVLLRAWAAPDISDFHLLKCQFSSKRDLDAACLHS